MKRQNIYKQIALSLLLLVGMAGTAWGQEQEEIVPVKNENAGTVTYGTNVDVSKDARIPIIPMEEYPNQNYLVAGSLNYTTNHDGNNSQNPNTGRPRNDLSNIFDGIVDGNSWCEFTPEDEGSDKGKVGLAIMFNSAFVIDKIEIIRGVNGYESPKNIEIQYGISSDKQLGTYLFENLEKNNDSDAGKPLLITLKNPINLNTDSKSDALVIYFTVSDDLGNYNFALDEIILHGYFDVTVTHKSTKWRALHDDVTGDSFDDCEWFTSGNSSVQKGLQMQPAHHYTDTIYMKKGETRTLVLPDRGTNETEYANINNKSYQRWYDYKTDGLLGALKPKKADENNLIPIRNGFLALPYQQINENQNTPTPYQIDFTYPEDGEDSYIIACDVSNYIDVNLDLGNIQPNEDGERTLQEPTLTHRILYYIKAVDDNETMEKDFYHEEYDISFPFTRISNHTLDLVALSKDADAYAFPGTDDGSLSIEVTNNTAGIKLQAQKAADTWFNVTNNGKNATISGNHRTISFAYPNTDNTYGTQSVNTPQDGSEPKATIKVTKTINSTTYNIATYNLTFVRNTVLLTQSIIAELEKDEEEGDGQAETPKPWDGYKFRTPKALADNYDKPLRELNWDYDKVTIGQGTNYSSHYYPYPMYWSYSTYGFFDGSQNKNQIASIRNKPYPEWGHYAITDGYIESLNNGQEWAWPTSNTSPAPSKPLINSEGKESTFHLYVDASDRPGTIARLAFPGDLCAGSEIIVSAWVKSAASWNKDGSNDDASVLFTIMGVQEDDTRTPLYRHCTGQIRNTLYMSDNIPGCGSGDSENSGNNEWLQVYFSFINEAAPNEYDEYLIQIDNYSASSNGADVYFDDIRCYVAKPQPRVTQQKLTCGERTRVRMDLDWEQLISRVGDTELTGEKSNTENGIDFCFIDIEEYRKAFSSTNNIAEALEQAAVSIGREGGDYDRKYGSLYYDLNYEKNEEYEEEFDVNDDTSGSLADKNTGEGGDSNKRFFYRAEAEGGDNYYEEGERLLSVDFFVDMSQGRDYWILIRDHNDDIDGDASILSLFGDPEDDCAIKAEFQVEGQSLIKMNGVVYNPKLEYCAGQIFNFTVDMRYYDESTKQETSYDGKYGPIYYDWFFGTQTEFEETQVDSYNMTLAEALQYLRTVDPDASASDPDENGDRTLVRTNETAITDSEEGDVTEKVKGVIEHYLNEDPEVDGLRYRLELHRPELEIRILEDGLNLMVAPIARTIGTEGNQIQLCFEPIPFELEASNHAPKVQAGFPNMNYPNEAYNPAMRIGLQQIIASSGNEGTPITINLRNAEFAFDKNEYQTPPDYIGLRHIGGEDSEDLDHNLYLTASDDPALQDIFKADEDEDGFDPERYVIGRAETLCADPDAEGGAGTITVKFKYNENIDETDEISSPKFEPREGYYYTFMVRLEDHNENHDVAAEKETCWGNLMIMMKVVPEYLVWQGNEYGDNWNNDSHWKRATNTDIQAATTIEDYGTGYDDNRGYVPMLFSKVIIPKNGRVELYKAGFEEENGKLTWKTTINDPDLDHMEPPANVKEDVTDKEHPIQYDMMVYTKYKEDGSIESMSTKPYRPNLVDQIHFEPNAEMLHAELLDYNKAWVDYKLESGKWHTLASPLQGVVAGDFYTDSETGTEEQEYFTDITFDGKIDNQESTANKGQEANSRFQPSVYQRGWDKEAKMISVESKDDKIVAVQGNWSAVYNNVYEKYNPGEGFSVKVLDMPDSKTEAIFRLPKADKSYDYYSNENNKIDNTTSSNFTRSESSGKLQITPSDNATDTEALHTVTLSGDNDYYLIGNPFMAHLDAAKFFSENSDVLQQKYWTVTNDVQNVAASNDGEWTTTLDNVTIAPLQSFFVQKKSDTADDATVKFTADMQTLSEKTSDEGSSSLILTAKTADGKMSRAAIAYDMSADKDYAADEDAELFLDSNLSDVPAIYTVAGTMATSINRTSELYNIPVGIYGHSTEMVTLSFEGLKHFSSATLYDAEKKTETPLREGTTLTVPANTSGRYFLRAGTPTGNEILEADDIQIYTLSGNRVMVTSSTPLKDIHVYNLGGALTKHVKAGVCSFELYLPDGIYIVTAENANGEVETEKVSVR